MNTRSLDTLTRRASLAVLGGLGAAGLVATEPPAASGKSSARKKSRKRCKKDTAACLVTLRAACAKDIDVEACVTAFTPCCEACSANGFFDCYLNTVIVVE